MTTRVAPLASISIDCPDADVLATFYVGLMGLQEAFATPDRSLICLSGAGPMLTLMQVADYSPPVWPQGPQTQQMHFDLAAADLEADVAAARRLGATPACSQPNPDLYRVMLDPAGYPFCLTLARAG